MIEHKSKFTQYLLWYLLDQVRSLSSESKSQPFWYLGADHYGLRFRVLVLSVD